MSTEMVSARLPVDLVERAREGADKAGVTFTAYLQAALEAYAGKGTASRLDAIERRLKAIEARLPKRSR